MMSQWNPYKQAFVFQVLESLLGSAVARKCSVLQIHRGKVPSMPNWMFPLFKVRGEPVIPSIFLWLKNFPRHRATAYRLQLHSRKKKKSPKSPSQMHYKVQKHLRLYNSHNMVPQIKSQEETQQWDWALEPAVSLSKSNKKKKANVQVVIVWIIVQRVSFSSNNSSHIISHILFTLPIYQLCHFSPAPFSFSLLVFLLLLLFPLSLHLSMYLFHFPN